jgi:hypothetical protein
MKVLKNRIRSKKEGQNISQNRTKISDSRNAVITIGGRFRTRKKGKIESFDFFSVGCFAERFLLLALWPPLFNALWCLMFTCWTLFLFVQSPWSNFWRIKKVYWIYLFLFLSSSGSSSRVVVVVVHVVVVVVVVVG